MNIKKKTSNDRLAMKCESFERPNFVDLLVFENSTSKANINEQHICFYCLFYEYIVILY